MELPEVAVGSSCSSQSSRPVFSFTTICSLLLWTLNKICIHNQDSLCKAKNFSHGGIIYHRNHTVRSTHESTISISNNSPCRSLFQVPKMTSINSQFLHPFWWSLHVEYYFMTLNLFASFGSMYRNRAIAFFFLKSMPLLADSAKMGHCLKNNMVFLSLCHCLLT